MAPAVQQLSTTLQTTFKINEGLVNDPFREENLNLLQLWRSADKKHWMWLDGTTYDLVYLQQWDASSSKNKVLWFP